MDRIELMKKITSSFTLYEAGRWLSKERPELNNDTPAEYIKKNKIKEVAKLLQQDVEKK